MMLINDMIQFIFFYTFLYRKIKYIRVNIDILLSLKSCYLSLYWMLLNILIVTIVIKFTIYKTELLKISDNVK